MQQTAEVLARRHGRPVGRAVRGNSSGFSALRDSYLGSGQKELASEEALRR